ncbi:MAG: hypothetical protein JW900_05915 [Anaerolineae bacterium]|nr:hypothetical protein [Anaerolineae bacterium]
MKANNLLTDELRRSVQFFLDHTNRQPGSPGFGLTVDSTKRPAVASIASTGFALTAWVIAAERGLLGRQEARALACGTLHTLWHHAPHYRGFFAHFLHLEDAGRFGKSEYSTIDTALCLNGVLTAAAYWSEDAEIADLAARLLARVDWAHFVFEREGQALFRMAYNPDRGGDYVCGEPGFISQWDMAAEQKMMYLQAAPRLEADLARRLYGGFRRDVGDCQGQVVIVNPGGNLFAYQFSEAWLDTARFLDPDGTDWFENTRRAALANRAFCVENAGRFKTYHAGSWGLSAGDSPRGYRVFGGRPCLGEPHHDGTVCISAAVACLPFLPAETLEMMTFLHRHHPRTWGPYGFFDAYNLDVSPPWYGRAVYAINKGCSMIMIENHLSGLIWDTYTNSPEIQKALSVLGFRRRLEDTHA